MEAALTGDKQAVIDISDMFNTSSVERQSKALYKQLGEDADIYVKKLKGSLNSYTDFQKEVHDELYLFSDSTGISLAGLDRIFAKSSENAVEYGKRLKKEYDKVIEEIKLMQLPSPLAYDKDKLDKLQNDAKVMEHMLSKSYIEKGSSNKKEREADSKKKNMQESDPARERITAKSKKTMRAEQRRSEKNRRQTATEEQQSVKQTAKAEEREVTEEQIAACECRIFLQFSEPVFLFRLPVLLT